MSPILSAVYRHCIRHLDSLHSQDVTRATFEPNGTQRWFASHPMPQPLMVEFSDSPVTTAPLIFQVIGQISRRKEIVKMRNAEGKVKKAIFWVECRADRASQAMWAHIPHSLGLIATKAESYLSLSRVFEIDRDSGILRLRMVWTASEALENQVCLPIHLILP